MREAGIEHELLRQEKCDRKMKKDQAQSTTHLLRALSAILASGDTQSVNTNIHVATGGAR